MLKDLIAARMAVGGEILFGTKVTAVDGLDGRQPVIRFAGADGMQAGLDCDFIVGADGAYGVGRAAIPDGLRRDYQRVYPFGWFGILCNALPSSEELIYARHDLGFALISNRTPEVQRMYFQCDPNDKVENWSDRIWAELQARVAGEDGFRLIEGEIFQRNIAPMRSYVCEPMQHGRLFLAGDAAHTVPPTGAKGLNLAASDVFLLDRYSTTAQRRVWRAQHFSWWMTSMLHRSETDSAFDERRQMAELELVTGTVAAATSLAENYVGLPFG
ncbi:p-hydroxybenzoate 3-monooxygenase [Humitalea rosea]|uniref:p-hydroxybenzoate 3-monooxygenase n=1 Tax=Humitalea rosea TaxID=990373 RepID=A0A2W7HTZ1_9PROT|nr:p-hydroxybenzoate 3-monooxygenase [Humitalea rosea]